MTKIIPRELSVGVAWQGAEINSIMQRIYLARGITSSKDLEYDLSQLLPWVDLMGVEAASTILYEALTKQQSILIIGDYDTDGATSTVLAIRALKEFGHEKVTFIVPNRFDYGYGLTPEIVEVAKAKNPELIITVDNGIASVEGVNAANQAGIKVLVTDHHLPGATLPAADVIVNPCQVGDQFASKNLAGVGVIFYVMLALRKLLREKKWFNEKNIPEPNMGDFLDLVALGTVADLVQLDKNNRILVHHGLKRINSGKCCHGIKILLQMASKNYQTVTAGDLAFILAPRLNAAGRLDDMTIGIECLLGKDHNSAYNKASQLNTLNVERKAIEKEMQWQAIRSLDNILRDEEQLPAGLCLYDETWHQGVVGIIAARMKDRTHRPVIAFAKVTEEELKGSARSVANLHIRDMLNSIAINNPDLITKFGGHAMAAGLSLPLANYEQFSQIFANEVGRILNVDDLKGCFHTDGSLTGVELTIGLAKLIREGGPWGQGFPEPLFSGEFNIIDQRLVGQKHLKLELNMAGAANAINGIAFNVDTKLWPNYRCTKIFAVYRLDVNEYNGRKSLQIMIEHLVAK
jgi:single-stranded-DNA-specific exonuclease